MDDMSRKVVALAVPDLEVSLHVWTRVYREKAESPIELLLAQTFVLCHLTRYSHLPYVGCGPLDPDAMFLGPQVVIGDYRVDFLLRDGFKDERGIVVECDGHDFHERTKEQAIRDRSRDRWLTLQGYTVLRFTGAEVWRDAQTCAVQIIEAAEKRREDLT